MFFFNIFQHLLSLFIDIPKSSDIIPLKQSCHCCLRQFLNSDFTSAPEFASPASFSSASCKKSGEANSGADVKSEFKN